MTHEPAREVEFQQNDANRCRRTCGESHEVVDRDRRGTEQFDDAGTIGGIGVDR
jgi:hypothetical protein